jgi:hypothetical protein
MGISLEYLERRCAINEMVLHDLGLLIQNHLPSVHSELCEIGNEWQKAIDRLDAELPQK